MRKLLQQIRDMDTKSDEFFQVFDLVNEKYFTFDKPDEFQQAAYALNLVLHRGEEWMVEVTAKIAQQIFETVEKGIPATHMSFDLKDKMYFMDLYHDKEALGAVHKMFRNAVVMKAKDELTAHPGEILGKEVE